MPKAKFSEEECPIAHALHEVGDWWTLLIVREAIYGTCKYEEFHRVLGIARNILSERLKSLVDNGILIKSVDENDRRSSTYTLTAKGRALWPVIVSLLTWSNRWIAKPGKHLLDVKSIHTGVPIKSLTAVGPDGEAIDIKETEFVAGPGASAKLREKLKQQRENAAQ